MDEAYFQQDGATCHTTNASMKEIEMYFGDFFLWSLLKGRVYNNNRRTIDTLRGAIRLEVTAITDVTLPDVFANLQTHIQKCLDAGGDHFQNML
ncbi:hypothetical protein B7P43_G13942 [Cryptotermes secundus]|uniref:Tc1-like transposase DDE domain-containing protein n=1 Tax=Cryptotermes secundus TaxID=105785 RepID=A0A2J7Q8C6_9NEOP|nr:hypothetical protein B7P43_G13942 [Cryptotermes secundus]